MFSLFPLGRLAGATISVMAALATASVVLADPPTTYNAHTDLNYYNNPTKGQDYPPLPNWGGLTGAGTIIKDPSFGCPILRVTDGNTHIVSGQPRPFTTDSSSEARTWNTNSTIFWVEDAGGSNMFAFNLNKTTLQVTKNTDPLPLELNDFSASNANVCYGKDHTLLVTHDFSTHIQENTIVDAQSLTSIPLNNRLGSMHVSRINGPVACVIGGGTEQDTDFLCITYNITTGVSHVLNLQNQTIDGVSYTPTGTIPTLLHNASIALGGSYVCLDGKSGQGVAIWDVDTGAVYQIVNQPFGHKVLGYAPGGVPAFVNSGNSLTQTMPPNNEKNDTWLIRSLASGSINTYNDLVEHPTSDAAYFAYDNHVSWNNSVSSSSQPVFADTYHIYGTSDPQLCWGDEIVAIGTSLTSNNTVYRFAQHRSIQNKYGTSVNFYDQPRGNISQDGMYFMFTSNYGNSLGTWVTGGGVTQYREDVFVIHLDQSATK